MTQTIKSRNLILADGRWSGKHGIGRFSFEILRRLKDTDVIVSGPHPLSVKNIFWQAIKLRFVSRQYKVFFTPGFNPIFSRQLPYVLTICDLIYLHTPGIKGWLKKIYFELFVKSSIKNALKVFTISEYSKQSILRWTKIPAEKVINVSCGISDIFKATGPMHQTDFPYLLHVGNTKTHKNILRLLQAFITADIPSDIKLILTGEKTAAIANIIKEKSLQKRIVFSNTLSESQLAAYYRGALALVFPSLYEGFGLPILEAMACGTPVLTSNSTSCPEVAGDAAVLVDAFDVHSIRQGIETIINNHVLRHDLIAKGFQRVKHFSWDKTAKIAQEALN